VTSVDDATAHVAGADDLSLTPDDRQGSREQELLGIAAFSV
jgi:hypothetical protein